MSFEYHFGYPLTSDRLGLYSLRKILLVTHGRGRLYRSLSLGMTLLGNHKHQ
jgi:hypothetical protein